MGLEYVDIFYSHRYDPETPLEETMGALGLRPYAAGERCTWHLILWPQRRHARRLAILREMKTPFRDSPAFVLDA